MTSASRGLMEAADGSRSRGDVLPSVRVHEGEATVCATEAGALRTSDAWDLLFTLPVARARLRRELSLSALCLRRDRQRRIAVIRTAALFGYTLDELKASAGGRALSGSGRSDANSQRTRGDVRATLRSPMQKFWPPYGEHLPACERSGDARSSNHAMQRTAGSLAIHA